ncbi:TPA: 50S ribosomal protein L5 [Candidatus Micrarchaeota archaeon]|nr:50S ribosomal protein L5 [Candidatus Micrarchaeota archaeon]
MSENSNSTGNSKSNPMREILIDKVTVNIGVGSPGERLDYAKELLSKLSGNRTPVETKSRTRNPVFKLRVGLPIGTKVTLRSTAARTFLDKALSAKKKFLLPSNFDSGGNFSFGIAEYIDFPGAKYDPKIGMFGFDVCVTLRRRGSRVKERRFRTSKIGKSHRITRDGAQEFAKSVLGVKFAEE